MPGQASVPLPLPLPGARSLTLIHQLAVHQHPHPLHCCGFPRGGRGRPECQPRAAFRERVQYGGSGGRRLHLHSVGPIRGPLPGQYCRSSKNRLRLELRLRSRHPGGNAAPPHPGAPSTTAPPWKIVYAAGPNHTSLPPRRSAAVCCLHIAHLRTLRPIVNRHLSLVNDPRSARAPLRSQRDIYRPHGSPGATAVRATWPAALWHAPMSTPTPAVLRFSSRPPPILSTASLHSILSPSRPPRWAPFPLPVRYCYCTPPCRAYRPLCSCSTVCTAGIDGHGTSNQPPTRNV